MQKSAVSMAPQFKKGDLVRVASWPPEFDSVSYTIDEETKRVYRHLIDTNSVIEIVSVDEFERPLGLVRILASAGHEEYHYLMLEHSCVQKIEGLPGSNDI